MKGKERNRAAGEVGGEKEAYCPISFSPLLNSPTMHSSTKATLVPYKPHLQSDPKDLMPRAESGWFSALEHCG